eukprot:4343631-Pyramimonas_sp.AAC.1
MHAVRHTSVGRYWSGVVLVRCISLSAHILDHLEEGGRAEEVFFDAVNYAHAINMKYPYTVFEVVLGVDANVSLPAGLEGLSESDV